MSNLNYHKSFILEHVDKESDVLPMVFYSDLNLGKYIGLKFVILNDVYFFCGKHKSKTGFYKYGLLCYSLTKEKFFILFPCFFTVKKIQNLYESSTLHNEDKIIILVKKLKKKKYSLPRPIWENGLLRDFFDPFAQIYLYKTYSDEDDNSGKVLRIVPSENLKKYLYFIKLYGSVIDDLNAEINYY